MWDLLTVRVPSWERCADARGRMAVARERKVVKLTAKEARLAGSVDGAGDVGSNDGDARAASRRIWASSLEEPTPRMAEMARFR